MHAVIPAAVAVGLVLACLWPRLWEVEQEVHALRAQLQHAHQQQQIAFQRAHAVQEQLLAHVELVAYQSFDGGKYAEAASRYVENSQWEPARAGEYAIKAATAAWYGCHYEEALHLLASQRGDPGDPILQQFVLGTVYHSLGRWDAAQQQYEQVIAAGPSARLEAAWFNLGVYRRCDFGRPTMRRRSRVPWRLCNRVPPSPSRPRDSSTTRGWKRLRTPWSLSRGLPMPVGRGTIPRKISRHCGRSPVSRSGCTRSSAQSNDRREV